MEFNFKKNVNGDSLIIRKKIIDEAIQLVTNTTNYTNTDLKFYLMLSLVDVFVEENIIVYCLSDDEKLDEKLVNTIEPLFCDLMSKNEELKNIYEELYIELQEYMNRECKNNRSSMGVLNNIIKNIGEIDFTSMINYLDNLLNKDNEESNEKITKIKTIQNAEEESEKIKELINQFTINKNENTTK